MRHTRHTLNKQTHESKAKTFHGIIDMRKQPNIHLFLIVCVCVSVSVSKVKKLKLYMPCDESHPQLFIYRQY